MLGLLAAAAPPLAIETRATPIHDIAEIGAAIATHSRQDGGGLLVLPDSYTITNRAAIIGQAASARLPAIYWNRAFAVNGGLISYGTDNDDLVRRSATYIDRKRRKGERSSSAEPNELGATLLGLSRDVVLGSAVFLNGEANGGKEVLRPDWLGEEVDRAGHHRLNAHGDVALNGPVATRCSHLPLQFEAIHSVHRKSRRAQPGIAGSCCSRKAFVCHGNAVHRVNNKTRPCLLLAWRLPCQPSARTR